MWEILKPVAAETLIHGYAFLQSHTVSGIGGEVVGVIDFSWNVQT